jgi:hypothetical protein
MASIKSAIAAALDAGSRVSVRDVDARLKVYRARIDLAAQAVVGIGETIDFFDLPPGFLPWFGFIHSSVTLGATATLAIGIAGTAGKYRAAAVFTTPDAPTLFGVAANLAPLTAKERLIGTVGVAALPASGILIVGMAGTLGD